MTLAWVLPLVVGATNVGADAALDAARADVQKQDWSAASQHYGQAAALMPGCDELEYDVGTAAAQADRIGLAVLHFERALRANPWDGDARQNLERIRQKRVDKVMGQEPGESPVQRLFAGIPGRSLFWLSLLLYWAGFALWVLRGLGRSKIGRGSIALMLLVAAVAFAAAQASEAERAVRYAVVVDGQGGQGLKVHSGPAADLPSQFEVHDGLKVLVLDAENGFVHIRLGNGLEGYVPESGVQEI